MKKISTVFFLSLVSFALFGQAKPDWLDNNIRNLKFPPDVFLTGFAQRALEKSISNEIEQAKLDAQADLTKQIRSMIKTKTQSSLSTQSVNGQYDERESFENESSVETNSEITGMKTEVYHDKSTNNIYAFAYANKYELIGYYKSNLSVNVGQIESFVKTAQDLEATGEKAKARQQIEMAKPLFSKVRYAQDLLTAIDPNVSQEELQQQKTESLYNLLTQMQARLAQGVYVFVESSEDLSGQKVDIVANKVKAELAKNGCSFVETAKQADFRLSIKTTTRKISEQGNIVFCYADVTVGLFDNHKQKNVYNDEFSQKGGSTTYERAAREAFQDAAQTVVGKIIAWIK